MYNKFEFWTVNELSFGIGSEFEKWVFTVYTPSAPNQRKMFFSRMNFFEIKS
jgi:hypothetical protein